jgi:tRNA modification GTPase
MTSPSTPIAAIATAPGRGGIGVVRISGGKGGALLAPLMQPLLGKTLQARHASYSAFLDAAGAPIDQGIALWFPAPHSYTGEDVLELQGHGGPVVMQLLLARVLEAGRNIGLRVAQPGEFTRRAFENGKLDLAQAESVADLIEASTEAAARGAAASLSGAFSREVHGLMDRITHLRMLVEATLDFPEEEIDFLEKANARGQLAEIRAQLEATLNSARQGALLREGLKVVLVGEPNVGKSSLLNALAGAEVAIVTPIAGTTRDRVSETIQIDGVPLVVIDTAGLRDAADEVERIGIERTWEAVRSADVILHLVDAQHADAPMAKEIEARLPAGVARRTVVNKIDLAPTDSAHPRPEAQAERLYLSAKTGEGIDALRRELLAVAGWQRGSGEGRFIARERHLQALRLAREHLRVAAEHAAQSDRVLDLFAEELRLAQEALAEITGEFTADDLLGVIFSRFCIGK